MVTEAEEAKLVEEAFERLVKSYLDSPHRKKVDLITKAFNFARQAHKGVRRLSGEPYIMHPLAVAQIVSSEMGLGSTSICSALLHDVVEDTEYTVEDLKNIFGPKIAEIVDGLTKISGGVFGDHSSPQAENLKKLLLTMSDDIRVILIKICDRLHNMRTLASQPKNKQYKIAGETLYIYAPLAYRLGLNQIKSELENLSFKYEHPDTYNSIVRQLKLTQKGRDDLFQEITQPIRKLLDQQHITYQLKARIKTPYSIWQKMQNKNIPFNEIYDILAVRIIITPKDPQNESDECFNIYSLLNKIYTTQNERLRDWINHPKANGYQALHTTIMTQQGWIEVQIRTDRMDQIAERGIAAHWRYKLQQPELADEGELGTWLTTIQEILNDPQPDALDFLDTIKLNLFAKEILVYTPKGEFKTMPSGATALDFAYHIHTFLGTHAIGAKVNHKLVPISHELNSGDQVEILTSPSQHPQNEWLTYAHTAKAKTKIRAALRRREREVRKAGQEILNQWLAQNDLQPTTPILHNLAHILHQSDTDNLYLAIGSDETILKKVKPAQLITAPKKNTSSGWKRYIPFLSGNDNDKKTTAETTQEKEGKNGGKPAADTDNKAKKASTLKISEDNYDQFIHPDCCHPIPGDDILGYIDPQNRIQIHRRDCPVANKLKASYGKRILDAEWAMLHRQLFTITITLEGIDRKGILHDVAEILSDQLDIDIRSININTNQGIFNGTVQLRIHDRKEAQDIAAKLKKVTGVKETSITT